MIIGKWPRALILIAALAGAAGVGEAAYAAHGSADPLLQTSSNFLLIHATAVIALTACASSSEPRSKSMLLASSVLLFGTLLFCGDLSARVFTGQRLFPMAAPTGGSLQIIGWLTAVVSATLPSRRTQP
jgi:uncharacterized membrane protein YgdD (TMEM256/DUF423 family)